MLKKMLFAVGGAALGVLLALDGGGEEAPCELKTATYRITTSCLFTTPRLELWVVLAEARRPLMENGWEYGGMITRGPDGRACVSQPATSEHPTRIRLMYHLPEGHALIGTYHSHPGDDVNTYRFSGTDVVSACLLNKPSYIVTESGLVMLLLPTPRVCLEDLVRSNPGAVIGTVQP